jgi:putative membrane protein
VVAVMHDSYNSWAWWWMIPMMLIIIAAVVGVVWAIVYAATWPPSSTSEPAPTPEQTLANRFALGAIDADEHHARLEDLQHSRQP